MILRLSSNAQRAVLLAAGCGTGLFLSYFSIRTALAAHYAGLQTAGGYERATQLEPANPQNWYLLGRYWQYNLEDPDAARAIRFYLSALSLNPASSETWLDLATAYESEGSLTAARDAFLHAQRAYPLSPDVSWRYGNFLLRQRELEPAFAEIRHAVEVDPERGAEAFSRALRVEPNIEKILDRILPPIGGVYVDVIWDQITAGQTDIALKVWDRLVAIHPQVPLRDVFPLVRALKTAKRITDAHRVWDQAVVVAGMADLQGPPRSVLWDGGFESGVTGGEYSWLFPEGLRNLQFSIDAQEKHSGNHSLRLTFDGRTIVTSTDICHYVPVEPSASYRFSAWVKTRAVTTDQGVRFQLHSLGTQDTSVTVTPDVHGSEPWTRLEIPWSAGNDVQEVQVCLIRLLSDQIENKIKGTTWVDDVALVPESAEHSKP
ncbi:MAG TPA: tetratricopeptide repeat protein [Candidatus Acidoferrum sp.]|nr:tetratricopeptide repeat protein [Candidatus Acidoferrum sp.]